MPNYLAWRDANHVFADVAATDEYRMSPPTIRRGGKPKAFRSAAASSNYFGVLGVSPQLGRTFAEGEDQPGRDHVVILSHELWERHFGSDASLIGRTHPPQPRKLHGHWRDAYELSDDGLHRAAYGLLSYDRCRSNRVAARKDRSLLLFARLKPGVTIEQARAEFVALARRAKKIFPKLKKAGEQRYARCPIS